MIGIDFSDRLTFDTQAFLVAGPTVWNSLPDSLRDPAVEYNVFGGISLPDIRDMSALEVSSFHVIALSKSTFTYLLT